MIRQCALLIGVTGSLLSLTDRSAAQDWTRFRGPNGAGVNTSGELPLRFSADEVRWRVTLSGVGHASPVVWGDRVFVSSGDDESGGRSLVCLSRVKGDELWSLTLDSDNSPRHDDNSLASTTPVVDEQFVYLAWGTPEHIWVVAVSHDGEEAWRTDLGPYQSGHGFGQSPIRHADLLILPVEHQGESFRAALDVRDGSVRWRVPCSSSLHYATPCVRPSADGRDELIFVNWEQGISGVDPQSGLVSWNADVFDKSHIESSISSPVLAGKLVVGVSGWLGHGYEAIAVDPDRPADKVVWKLDRGAPLCTTPIVVGDCIYFWSDQGVVTCIEAASGDVQWRERVVGNYYSSPVSDGKRILNVSTEGEVVILEASSDYRLLARDQLDEGTHATPAIEEGDLFLRTFSSLICLRAGD
jgi:outer membrane protein assembly factor BamB